VASSINQDQFQGNTKNLESLKPLTDLDYSQGTITSVWKRL